MVKCLHVYVIKASHPKRQCVIKYRNTFFFFKVIKFGHFGERYICEFDIIILRGQEKRSDRQN